jgi:hypothetical protein
LTRMCSFAQFYFNPEGLTEMFDEFLPYVSKMLPYDVTISDLFKSSRPLI